MLQIHEFILNKSEPLHVLTTWNKHTWTKKVEIRTVSQHSTNKMHSIVP
jgi:hypothetical protein